jgi:signal peptidase I
MTQRNRVRPVADNKPSLGPEPRFAFWRRRGADAPPKSRLRQNIESLLLAVGVALLVRSSVVEAFWVPSGSMLPTIQIGDHLFVNKLAYGMHLPFVGQEITQWRPVHRSDIVVFTSPVDRRIDLIKRVIAVAGDTVEIRNKHLFINGEEVPDPHANFTDPRVRDAAPRDKFGPVTVPPGKFFVMGDNRDQSYDSRYWGFADERDVKGQATFIYWSWNSQADWLQVVRWDRLGHFIR